MRLPLLLAFLLATPALAAPPNASVTDARIARLLAATPLIDGHNDWAEQLRQDYGEGWWAVDLAADARTFKHPLQTDIPRLRAGGLGGQFWSVYVPASLSGAAAIQATLDQIDIVRGIVARYPATFELASTAADVRRIHKAGRIASLIGVEGGHQMGESLPALRMFYALGARYMTLTHFANNAWADSATDAPAHNGLTPFGNAVVVEMNRLGMLVDLSHVSEKTMTDALSVTKAPVIFSHSSARALNDHPRNVSDAVLRLLPANGGVVMVNWVPSFDDPKRFQYEQDLAGAQGAAKVRYIGQPERIDAAVAAWKATHPRPVTTVAMIADHIEHVAKVAGHAHVGFGADLDGIPDTPQGLDGVDTYPVLLAELARRGWSDADLATLAGGNVLRALERAEKVAAGLRGALPTTAIYEAAK